MKRFLMILAVLSVALNGCGRGKGGGEKASESVASATTGSSEQAASQLGPDNATAPLAAEPIPNVLTLPADYPDTWFFADDIDFPNMVDGRIVILDAAAATREYKGQLPAGMAAAFAQSWKRHELYVAETIHEYRVSGPRHDYLLVYNTETLKLVARIDLPAKRYQGMPYRSSMILIDNDRLALIFNFTPAASVTVVDLEAREVLSEIPVPGCAMMFPVGERGFATVCGNGGITTIKLDENGEVASQIKLKPFIDIDNNALFLTNANIDKVRYFPTYQGDIQPIDFRGDRPKVMKKWPLTSDSERQAGWRPGGWQLITNDARGDFYILMHPNGAEGTHKDPSSSVWVYSAKDKRRVRQLSLKTPAISIEATKGEKPYLLAFNINMQIDVYEGETGAFIKTINDAAATPFALYAVE